MKTSGLKTIKSYCCPGHSTQKNKKKRARASGKKEIVSCVPCELKNRCEGFDFCPKIN